MSRDLTVAYNKSFLMWESASEYYSKYIDHTMQRTCVRVALRDDGNSMIHPRRL